ncbi:MAG: hypothetical protein AAB355_03335 [Patescibacteria group bacterium]
MKKVLALAAAAALWAVGPPAFAMVIGGGSSNCDSFPLYAAPGGAAVGRIADQLDNRTATMGASAEFLFILNVNTEDALAGTLPAVEFGAGTNAGARNYADQDTTAKAKRSAAPGGVALRDTAPSADVMAFPLTYVGGKLPPLISFRGPTPLITSGVFLCKIPVPQVCGTGILNLLSVVGRRLFVF